MIHTNYFHMKNDEYKKRDWGFSLFLFKKYGDLVEFEFFLKKV